jgi:hypothetical protein
MAKSKEKFSGKGMGRIEHLITSGLLFLLPFLAIGFVTYAVVVTVTPDFLPLWAALLIGGVGGALWLIIQITTSGTDMMDVIVPCVVTIILALMWLKVVKDAKENRLRHKSAISTQVQKQPLPQN